MYTMRIPLPGSSYYINLEILPVKSRIREHQRSQNQNVELEIPHRHEHRDLQRDRLLTFIDMFQTRM